MIDLYDPLSVAYLHGLKEAAALGEMFLSKDRIFAVQMNTDGTFFIYRFSDGEITAPLNSNRHSHFDVWHGDANGIMFGLRNDKLNRFEEQ